MKAIPCFLLAFIAFLALSVSRPVSAAKNIELVKKKLTNNSARRRRLVNRTGGGKWWEEERFLVNGQPTTRGLHTKKNHGIGNGEAAVSNKENTQAAETESMPWRGLRAAQRLNFKDEY
jgi:hypothetical protein